LKKRSKAQNAKYKENQRQRDKQSNICRIEIRCYEEDKQAIRKYSEKKFKARNKQLC